MQDRTSTLHSLIGADGEDLQPPLIAPDEGCDGSDDTLLEFDTDGSLVATEPLEAAERTAAVSDTPVLTRPCRLTTLNGSWLLQIVPQGPPGVLQRPIRGPMRIEATAARLRASGDVYVGRRSVLQPFAAEPPIGPESLVIGQSWYPAFPQSQYRWYFRSTGCSFGGGVLTIRFERHLWNTTTQEFASSDTGSMRLKCSRAPVSVPGLLQPTIVMRGTATIGGRPHVITATKTSSLYRGCRVEVDVMTNRTWPATATTCTGQTLTFTGLYRAAGMDFRAVVNQTNIPESAPLTTADLHNLLAANRLPASSPDVWRLWLLVGSRVDGTLGIMFDTGNPPHREGAAGFFDPTLPNSPIVEASARGRKLGEVPLAFLRTLVHEAGHAFNLFHPKHDIHLNPVGTAIMDQTGDVLSFATAQNPYPCTATMAFDDHCGTSLIHSPDPQVKPGWKEFGWGHSATFAGVADPADAFGLRGGDPAVEGLDLRVDVPGDAHRGEFIVATVTLTNTDSITRTVTSRLNLAEGDLWFSVVDPGGRNLEVRDVVLACGERRFVELEPGAEITGQIQLLYTSAGFTFDQAGSYTLRAELDTGEEPGTLLQSAPVQLVMRPAATDEELRLERLATQDSVGLAFALGDPSADPAAEEPLTTLVEDFAETDTGVAAALTLVNARERKGNESAAPAADVTTQVLTDALERSDPASVARLAAAVASPIEPDVPAIEEVRDLIAQRSDATGDEEAEAAAKILQDHFA
jgi:hypothetical protein